MSFQSKVSQFLEGIFTLQEVRNHSSTFAAMKAELEDKKDKSLKPAMRYTHDQYGMCEST